MRLMRYSVMLLLVLIGNAHADGRDDRLPNAAGIATAHPLATAAGEEIMRAGGNAFDAAVAITAALAVVEPYGSGLGGGGFWLLHLASGKEVMIDGRERAPLSATRDMYLDADGNPISKLSRDGALAAGIPGTPAAMAHMAEKYGNLPLAVSLTPAIRYAAGGFEIHQGFIDRLERRLPAMRDAGVASQTYTNAGELPKVGFRLVQPELARTLQLLAREGAAGFYSGDIAARLVTGVRRAGGIWSLEDLRRYTIAEREPVVGEFAGARIVSAAPPSSGGVAIISALNILDGYDWQRIQSPEREHLIAEAWRRVYRDRAEYLGDPDYLNVPVMQLTSPAYAAGLRASIRRDKATPSEMLPGEAQPNGGENTTHFSVIDLAGNYVSATMSINFMFGSGFMPTGTGVLLNNEMDDFSAKPGAANAYGLVGAEANAIQGGKRMLSSMAPTFVQCEDGVGILGTPGGSRIITMVMLGILEYLEDASAEDIVALPRFHHQFLPDGIAYEPNAFSDDTIEALIARGHNLKEMGRQYGDMQVVIWNRRLDTVTAASDPRRDGEARVLPAAKPIK